MSPKHDITVDLDVGTTIGLHATEASIGIDLGKGDCVTGDHGCVGSTHCYAEVWELGVAGVGKATDLGVVGCALDFCVVGVCDLGVDEEEGGTGVCFVSVFTLFERGRMGEYVPAMAGEPPWLAIFWEPMVTVGESTCQKPDVELTGIVVRGP